MNEENALEQIRIRKIQDMLDAAKKSQGQVAKQPTIAIFHKGKEVERIIGAYSKVHIESAFKRYIENGNQT